MVDASLLKTIQSIANFQPFFDYYSDLVHVKGPEYVLEDIDHLNDMSIQSLYLKKFVDSFTKHLAKAILSIAKNPNFII